MLAETSIQCCSRVALFLIGLSVVACVMVNVVDFWGFKRNILLKMVIVFRTYCRMITIFYSILEWNPLCTIMIWCPAYLYWRIVFAFTKNNCSVQKKKKISNFLILKSSLKAVNVSSKKEERKASWIRHWQPGNPESRLICVEFMITLIFLTQSAFSIRECIELLWYIYFIYYHLIFVLRYCIPIPT